MMKQRVGLVGGDSLVGRQIIVALSSENIPCLAFTRKALPPSTTLVQWLPLSDLLEGKVTDLTKVICVTHIWIIPEYMPFLAAAGTKRLVAISSTSRFTKQDSTDADEIEVSKRLGDSETSVAQIAKQLDMAFTILRPTLIYGEGKDKNVAEIAAFFRRFGFFPIFGSGKGLRQPIHAHDVARACVAALDAPASQNKSYNITGSETISYKNMVQRIAVSNGITPRLLRVPISIFKLALSVVTIIPRFKKWTPDMAVRMNRDLVFCCQDAEKDFGFAAEGFDPSR